MPLTLAASKLYRFLSLQSELLNSAPENRTSGFDVEAGPAQEALPMAYRFRQDRDEGRVAAPAPAGSSALNWQLML